MSGLDQAFIKAYAKGPVMPGLAAPHMPLAPGPLQATTASVPPLAQQVAYPAPPNFPNWPIASSSAPIYGSMPNQGQPADAANPLTRVDPPSPMISPATLHGVAPPIADFTPQRRDASHEPSAAGGPHWHHAAKNAPASANQQVESSRSLSVPWTDTAWRPAYEVDYFQWPALVNDLIHRCGAELDSTANLLVSTSRGGQKVVAVVGASPSAGTTTLVACLARRLSASGLTAALVDANFSQPELARRLGLMPLFGWEDMIDHERNLSEVLVESIDDSLTLLPLSGPVASAATLGGDLYFGATLAALRDRYHVVLVDAGTVCPSSGIIPIWLRPRSGVEAAIVVGDMRDEGRDKLAATLATLADRNIDALGVVENFCPNEGRRLARRHRARVH